MGLTYSLYSLSSIWFRGRPSLEYAPAPLAGSLQSGLTLSCGSIGSGGSRSHVLPLSPPFPSPRRRRWASQSNAARSVALGLILTGCAHVTPKTHTVSADFEEPQSSALVQPSGILQHQIRDMGVDLPVRSGGRSLRAIKSERPSPQTFRSPFRLAFVAVSADLLLRRISEYTALEFVADDTLLASSSLTLDVTIGSSDAVFDVVETIGELIGASVRWDGETAIFSRTANEAEAPVNGYLITPLSLTTETRQIALDRYGVTCAPITSFTVCLGDHENLDKAQIFLRAVDAARDMIAFKVVTSEHDLTAVATSLGILDRVVVTSLSDRQWLLVSNDSRHFDLMLSVASSLSSSACGSEVFFPLHTDVGELLAAIPATQDRDCGGVVPVTGRLLLNGTENDLGHQRAVLTLLDTPRPLARLFVLIVNRSDAKSVSLGFPSWTGTFASGAFDDVAVAASISKASGWRTLDLVTDGQSTASISSTDRVEGNVIVTDGGSQIAGVENRTVGLTFNISGTVTPSGYRGRIGFSDSNLDNDVTSTASCDAFVVLPLGRLSRVCSYDRDDRSASGELLELSARSADQSLDVYVGLLAHETASLATLRKVLK